VCEVAYAENKRHWTATTTDDVRIFGNNSRSYFVRGHSYAWTPAIAMARIVEANGDSESMV
jgi:hypothetical protein